LPTSTRPAGHRSGWLGTPIICDALCQAGAVTTAYQLLLQDQCPSWLYQVDRGATTIWERWDGIRPDGTLNNGFWGMNSFNHFGYGAVGGARISGPCRPRGRADRPVGGALGAISG
jgi:alpha-L-rhamnosidase